MPSADVISEIKSIVGEKYVLTEERDQASYSSDVILGTSKVPLAIVLPGSTVEISYVIKFCNENGIKVAVRGGGTGVSGGVASDDLGIILSTQRLDKIIEINKVDMNATVEAGVTIGRLNDALLEYGLIFPQNISTSESSFIGGNVAISSGSPKSFKYGTTKDYVVNLEVVLPSGEIIWTGKNVGKNATGYNLTQLFVGSEGTLGIITKVVLKLRKQLDEILCLIPFKNIDNLIDCVHLLSNDNLMISSLEFIDKRGYQLVSQFLGKPNFFGEKIEGLLWIEMEGSDKAELVFEMQKLTESIAHIAEDDILFAESSSEINRLWDFRKKVGDAVINHSSFRDIDVVVPRSKIYHMYLAIREISEMYGFDYTLFGHIGDGNFHINLFNKNHLENGKVEEAVDQGISAIFDTAIKLGGTISGEHGIGTIHKSFFKKAYPSQYFGLMKVIKRAIDPNDILNSKLLFN